MFRAVLLESQKKGKKRRRKDDTPTATVELDLFVEDMDVSRPERFKGHRAGHDAFMTAYCFASFIAQKLSTVQNRKEELSWKDLVCDVRNRVCLSGKDFPLLIQKSAFSKCSKHHLEKHGKLFVDASIS